MPIISMFYGIIIRMYLLDNKHHNLPHIHARYAEFEASVGIDDGEIIAGKLPRKQLRLVQAWGVQNITFPLLKIWHHYRKIIYDCPMKS